MKGMEFIKFHDKIWKMYCDGDYHSITCTEAVCNALSALKTAFKELYGQEMSVYFAEHIREIHEMGE